LRVLHCLLQGVLYVTDVALCHYSNIIGVEVKDVIPLAHVTSLEKVVPRRASWSLRAWVSDRHHSPQLPQHVRRKMAVK